MKAIETRYRGATLTKPACIVAQDSDGNKVRCTSDTSGPLAHRRAAQMLCDKMGWTSADSLIGGQTKAGYAFVFQDDGEAIQRRTMRSAAGHSLDFFYNRDTNLLVVDLNHAKRAGGNELVRRTLDEQRLLAHCDKLPLWGEEV